MNNYFIWSGFVVAILLVIMGTIMIFSEYSNPQTKIFPYEIVGGLMIGWGLFRGYRSWIAYKRKNAE